MQRTDTEALIRSLKLNRMEVIKCQATVCSNLVKIEDAFAIETIIRGDGASAFLCSPECYLTVVDPQDCARA